MPFTLDDEQRDELLTWGQRLDAFRRHYRFSFETLAGLCGGFAARMTRSTLQRLCVGTTKDLRYAQIAMPHIVEGLRRFLLEKGRTLKEADAELNFIFDSEETAMIASRATLPIDVQRYFGLKRDSFTGDPRVMAAFTIEGGVDLWRHAALTFQFGKI